MNTSHLLRIKALQKTLKTEGCLVEAPLQLLYLTGLNLSCGKLLLSKTAALLLVDGRYLEVAQKKPSVPATLDGKEPLLHFGKQHKLKKWLFDSQSTSYAHFLELEKLVPACKLIPEAPLFEHMRAIKDRSEIAKMQASAHLVWKGFLFIKKSLDVGISERELAKKFELFCLEKGAEKLSFEPIIAFGPNSAMPHHRAGDSKLKKGDIVLVDIGVVVDKYHSDMTRMLFFKGKDPYLAQLYKLVKEAHKQALQLCRPGIRIGDLDIAAREVFRKEKVEHLFVHGLGHGIGLETHEFPRIKEVGKDKDTVLKRGMVFTIEPGLYVPGKGGVRYEDTIVVTDRGYKNFYTNEME